MEYSVLVQNPNPQVFTASVLELPGLTAQGRTKEEAVEAARAAIVECLNGEIVKVEVTENGFKRRAKPLLEGLGEFCDDPTYDDFLEQMAAYRRFLAETEAREAARENGETLPDTAAAGFGNSEANPWDTEVGRFRDDPTWDDFQAEMAAHRQSLDKQETL